ncbi:MAG TPA: protein kinase [Blastocatellia bacterium]|nr:protein kinase [Blastocatellia bacterium]
MDKDLSANATLSHYRIISKIGAGGMGEVYLAEDTRLRRKIALKVLPESIARDNDRLRRFEQEAFAASALNHPNILTIHEIGEIEGKHYIATEFIEGETLRHHIQLLRMKLRDTLDVMVQVASALSTAHQVGIIHRDIKPENIMVRPDGIVKVLDFGLAKLTEKQMVTADSEAGTISKKATEPGTIMGTVAYMSPEQARGKQVDARTDIFSLGILLYEMVTGRAPFAGESGTDVLAAILDKEPMPLARFADETPPELQRIVTKCLRKERDERYQTMKDVLLDLKELRDELAMEAKLERSIRPVSHIENQQTLIAEAEITKQPATRATDTPNAQTTSSAEYLVSEIKQHRRGVALASILLMAFIGFGYWVISNRATGTTDTFDSIAVLPFQNRSSDADTEYLSDGLAESLIYRLSQLPNLKVSPTNSVLRYKGKETDVQNIGGELGVKAVMTGRIAQRGDNLTISVELVDVRNNKTLWGEQYERRMSELLATQREIAGEIINKLRLKLSGEGEQRLAKKYTTSNEAYQLYLKGRFYWNKRNEENLRKAIEQFKAAADKDPNYALAFVGLADCYVLLPFYSSASATDVTPPAKAYAEHALEIDDSLGEAHTSLGYVNRLLWNWRETEKELKRALELNPNYATAHKFYGNYLCDMGRFDEGLAEYKRAQELEPLSLIIYANLAEVYLGNGDLNAGVEQCQRAIDLDPNWYYARLVLALVYLKQGRGAEALAEAEKSVELSKRLSGPLGVLGYVSAQTGKRSVAEGVVKELEEKYSRRQANGYDLARIYIGLGEKDLAVSWLEKDFKAHNATLPNFLYIPPLDSLRDDPRFKDLAGRIGLPELK